jgi:hypothetical protein
MEMARAWTQTNKKKEPRTTKEEMEGPAPAGSRIALRVGATRKVQWAKTSEVQYIRVKIQLM